jgi:hypothetical protein
MREYTSDATDEVTIRRLVNAAIHAPSHDLFLRSGLRLLIAFCVAYWRHVLTSARLLATLRF